MQLETSALVRELARAQSVAKLALACVDSHQL